MSTGSTKSTERTPWWIIPTIVALLLLIALIVVLAQRSAHPAPAAPAAPAAPVAQAQAPAAPAQAPAVVQVVPVQQAPAVGTRIELFEGRIILIHSGVGNICSLQSSVYWNVPVSASADNQGVKYFSNTPVPPGLSTFFDCHRFGEITIASQTYSEMQQPVVEPSVAEMPEICSVADIQQLAMVQDVYVIDPANGQARITFGTGEFYVPVNWDVDFYGKKYRGGELIQVASGQTATFWSPQMCKPLR